MAHHLFSIIAAIALTGCAIPPRYRIRRVEVRPMSPATLAEIKAKDAEAQAAARSIVFPPAFTQ